MKHQHSRGVGLIDALIALAILSFGLLALTRFQTRLVTQATESQERLTAVQLGDEFLNTVIVDTANRGCYELPASSACGSVLAAARAASWAERAVAALPASATAGAVLSGDQLIVTLTWTGKDSQETRTQTGRTDVR